MASSPLVLNADLLIRAVLGQRVCHIIQEHEAVSFFEPVAAYQEAEEDL